MNLIRTFVFASWKVQSFYLLSPKFQVASHLLCLNSPVCVNHKGRSFSDLAHIMSEDPTFHIHIDDNDARFVFSDQSDQPGILSEGGPWGSTEGPQADLSGV